MSAAQHKAHVVVGQIERMERIIDDSEMPASSKMLTADLLMSAKEAQNGAPDKLDAMARTLGYISVHIAASEKRYHDDAKAVQKDIKAAVETHITSCPLASGKGTGKLANICASLKPVAWPLGIVISVASVSPYLGPVIAAWAKLKMAGM